MDLLKWSLNAIDTIFSTRHSGAEDPTCPAGTHVMGYVMDSWRRWQVMCLYMLSVEDVEDVYIFGLVVTGFLMCGAGTLLVYRKIKKVEAALIGPSRLPYMIDSIGKAVAAQSAGVNRALENISSRIAALETRYDRL